jgi:preprotein translocase subunit SecY
MWDRVRSIWSSTDLRNKLLFTIGMLVIYRIIAHVPVPGIDPATVQSALSKNGSLNQVFGLLSVFSGGSISNFSIVGLGVYPYITASIVIQLLQPIIPALSKLNEEGDSGRNKLAQITRIVAVPLAFLQALGQLALFASIGAVSSTQFNLLNGKTFLPTLTTLLVMTTGVMLLVWIGEVITENGVGNGISLIIFVNILTKVPTTLSQIFLGSNTSTSGGNSTASAGSIITILVIGAVVAALIYINVYVTTAQRRVPVQYPSKRSLGGRRALMETRQASYIPMMVNQGGMIPLIFAQSLLLFPVILASYLAIGSNPLTWLKNAFTWIQRQLDPTGWVYPTLFFLLVFGFTFFYAEILFEQQNLADNLRKQGAFVAGVRPGADTFTYLKKVMYRIALGGALFLGAVAISPYILSATHLVSTSTTTNNLLSAASIIIVVQVALDTIRQVQAQAVMRNYTGFLR